MVENKFSVLHEKTLSIRDYLKRYTIWSGLRILYSNSLCVVRAMQMTTSKWSVARTVCILHTVYVVGASTKYTNLHKNNNLERYIVLAKPSASQSGVDDVHHAVLSLLLLFLL